jgi:hypothetical protein
VNLTIHRRSLNKGASLSDANALHEHTHTHGHKSQRTSWGSSAVHAYRSSTRTASPPKLAARISLNRKLLQPTQERMFLVSKSVHLAIRLSLHSLRLEPSCTTPPLHPKSLPAHHIHPTEACSFCYYLTTTSVVPSRVCVSESVKRTERGGGGKEEGRMGGWGGEREVTLYVGFHHRTFE